MKKKVKLGHIIDALEEQMDDTFSFLNQKTGEVYTLSHEELMAAEEDMDINKYPLWQQENIIKAKEIDGNDDYIALPTKFDINEYEIMERFCLQIEDEESSDIMYNSIKGSGAFRRFKDNIHRYRIEEKWYKYRDEAIKEHAIEWCKENDIEYDENNGLPSVATHGCSTIA